jgi:hypothetical protein
MEGVIARASGRIEPLRVFVAADDSQMVAARVLEFSIRQHASRPVDVTLMRDLPVPLPRDRRNRPRTGFSFYRFLIPKLCDYRGRALYLDADMLVFADLTELWAIPFEKSTVLCTYQPEGPARPGSSPCWPRGRQFSVMLLDCSMLDWDIDKIVRGLDEGRYTYAELMSDLCVVHPDRIADTIPPEWNRLESFIEGVTKLLHYTVVATQPWKSTKNPFGNVWMAAYRGALQAGAVDPAEVLHGIEYGFLHPSLADDLCLSPVRHAAAASPAAGDQPDVGALERELFRARAELAEARCRVTAHAEEVADLEETLADLRASWTWRIGRMVTGPLSGLRRAMRRFR